MPGRAALIVGATGLVGSRCLRLLIETPEYDKVIALVRRLVPIDAPRLEQRITDFASLGAADLVATDVYCALGTTIRAAGSRAAFARVDRDYVTTLAHRSLDYGAVRFLMVSSVGASAESRNFYLRTKGEAESAVAAMPFAAVHIFRPSFLVGKRAEPRPGERLGTALAEILTPVLLDGLRKYRPIAADAVAAAMIAAALRPLTGVHIWDYDGMMRLLSGAA